MSSYTDFLRQHAAPNARVRRLYWVCGEEEVFRFHTIARLRHLAGNLPFNAVTLTVGEISESEIWANLNQHPLNSAHKRLVVVHRAERLDHLDRLVDWVQDSATTRARNAVAVFESSDPDLGEDRPERAALMASSSTMVVRCSLPKDPEQRLARAAEVVCGWGNIDRVTAEALVRRVNFDMAEALAFMRKVSLFPAVRERGVSRQVVESLAPHRAEEDVVWNLIGMNKRQAVEAAKEASEVGAILGALATHVDALSRINALLSTTRSVKEIAYQIDAREHHVRMLLPHAGMYPRREAVRRTLLLNRLDNAYSQGAREGLLESLIALW